MKHNHNKVLNKDELNIKTALKWRWYLLLLGYCVNFNLNLFFVT